MNPYTCPFTVLVDTSEQLPYSFAGLRADASHNRVPLTVQTKPCNLLWGDYSIDGYADHLAVERKSAADLAGTLTRGRARFTRELEGLAGYDAAWVVVEAELSTLAQGVPHAPGVIPKTLWRSVMRFQLRYPRVHWWFVPGRPWAEALTFRLLEAWWRERIEGPARESRRAARQTRHSASGSGN